MCGIVGIAGFSDRTLVERLLMVDAVRGSHSTGVYGVGQGVVKQVGNPFELFHTRGFDTVAKAPVVIGHNRYATVGSINKWTAHPFETEKIVGVHNGTLRNWKSVLPEANTFSVDSECLIHAIDKLGIEEVWKKVDGAIALVWYDQEASTLNFVRNSERPMHISTNKTGDIVWASTPAIMEAALESLPLSSTAQREFLEVESLPIHTLVSYPVSFTKSATGFTTTTVLGDPVMKKLSPYVAPKPVVKARVIPWNKEKADPNIGEVVDVKQGFFDVEDDNKDITRVYGNPVSVVIGDVVEFDISYKTSSACKDFQFVASSPSVKKYSSSVGNSLAPKTESCGSCGVKWGQMLDSEYYRGESHQVGDDVYYEFCASCVEEWDEQYRN